MKFGQTMTVAAFKAKHNCTSLKVVENPTNSKLFVTADGITVAAVSKNYVATEPKEFVELQLEDGKTLWCLHNESSANVKEVL